VDNRESAGYVGETQRTPQIEIGVMIIVLTDLDLNAIIHFK